MHADTVMNPLNQRYFKSLKKRANIWSASVGRMTWFAHIAAVSAANAC
jgi:hypothetical protein